VFAGEAVYKYETFYSALEAIGAAAAILTSFLLFRTRAYEREERLYFLGMGFLVMGIMQFFHAATNVGNGMITLLVFSNLAGATWFAFLWLPHKTRILISRASWIIWLIAISATIFCGLVVFQRPSFPTTLVNGNFTFFVSAMSVLASALFLAAAVKLLYYSARSDEIEWFLFAGVSALLSVACANVFFSQIWDFRWWGMVVIRLAAFMFVADFLGRKYDTTFTRLMNETRERAKAEGKLERTLRSTRKMFQGTINVLSLTIEIRDPYTAGHQKRVARIACAIADENGMRKTAIQELKIAALLHDIGKISVPADTLARPGKLSEIEFALIKDHTIVGCGIIRKSNLPKCIADVALQHHERMNGSGYPNGLRGDKICRYAKILAVADVVEAMCSHRPYRPACGRDAALEEIEKNKGELYDPESVDACLRMFREKKFNFEPGGGK
jgi:putative nucleotidyltransferase with HDIG domain